MTDARTAAIRAEIDRLHKLIIEYRDRCQSHWMDRFDRRIATLEWVLALPDPPDRQDEAMRLEIAALKAKLAEAENERAEQWRLRREVLGRLDVEKAANTTLRAPQEPT